MRLGITFKSSGFFEKKAQDVGELRREMRALATREGYLIVSGYGTTIYSQLIGSFTVAIFGPFSVHFRTHF